MNYEDIFDKLIDIDSDVGAGLMMHEPALKYGGKVFVFYYQIKDAMCFKLGKGYPIEDHFVTDYRHLDPFKYKPPMMAWFVVSRDDDLYWDELTLTSLDLMRNT